MPLPDQPIDRRMSVRGKERPVYQPWWKPAPLTIWFTAIIAFDASILWVASGVSSSDSDAAGNGMANAFRDGFVEMGVWLLGVLALLFLLIWHRGIRIGLTFLLLPTTLLFLILLQ